MNILRFVAKSVGLVCVPIWFIDSVGSPGVVEGTSMEVIPSNRLFICRFQPTLKGSDKRWWKNDIVWLQKWFLEPREGQIFTFMWV